MASATVSPNAGGPLVNLRPEVAVGTRDHPGSSNALPGLVLPMSTWVAAVVLVGWAVVPFVLGARRVRTQDA
jgi:hypothetical protein